LFRATLVIATGKSKQVAAASSLINGNRLTIFWFIGDEQFPAMEFQT
jgi:hypothetical protein